MRKTVLAVFMILLAVSFQVFCGTKPTQPTPDPIPTPTPIPSPTPRPGPAWPFGAIICCDDPLTRDVDEGIRDGWSLANARALQQMADAGATWTHFRTGPFKDGSVTMAGLTAAVDVANSLGIEVEVDLIDNWALINHQTTWNDGCEVTQSAPRERHLQHVQDVVAATRHQRVRYNLGNEGGRCLPSPEWDRGLYDQAKRAGAGLVGSNSGGGIGDYFTVHGFEPTSNGVILTESDNRYHSPEEWVELYQESRVRGGYVMLWRAKMSDEGWTKLLALMRDVD